jgi:uncharacterized repeat protein (TIGR03803 family)
MTRTTLAASLAFSFALLTLAAQPAAAATEYILWNFKYANVGFPQGRLLIHGTSLYGTAAGDGTTGYGQVFKLHDSSGTWKITTAAQFDQTNGASPLAGLIADSSGAFYGTTSTGDVHGGGNVFKVWYSGGVWYLGTIWAFGASGDGSYPTSDLIWDSSGNLYGTTDVGGANNKGTVFKLSNSGGTWTESLLYSFAGSPDGAYPLAGLVMDKSGNLYGTTNEGGSFGCSKGCGTVFELTPSGGTWTEKVLYTFGNVVGDGSGPVGGLVRGAKGALYGTAPEGGAYGYGLVFELKQSGGTWKESTIYSFAGGSDGAAPYAGLRFNSSGALFGTTFEGGGSSNCSGGCGTVFSLS